MGAIYSPSEKGFDDRLTAIDRCQVALLREIVNQYGPRLILKDGMAMRAVFGSMRLTKDIDFDRESSMSLESAKNGLPKTLVRAASVAGIRRPEAEVTKLTTTTIRARLAGETNGGVSLRFEVEVSGRGNLNAGERRKETVVPPSSYGMAPFLVESWSGDMLAAMKVAAAMSEARNVPRDIYDLYDLLNAGASPARLLSSAPAAELERIQEGATNKLDGIGFALAREELLPYLPPDVRETLDEERWLEYTLAVGEAVERWAGEALLLKGLPP